MPSIATLNARGLGSADKFSLAIFYLREARVDLCCLTESHLTEQLGRQYERKWPGIQLITNSPRINTAGVTFLVLNPDRVKFHREFMRDADGYYLGASFEFDNDPDPHNRVRVLGVYAPARDNHVEFYSELAIAARPYRVKMVLGDFNTVEDPMDRNPAKPDGRQSVSELQALMGQHGLIDGWRSAYPARKMYTFSVSKEAGFSSSRLDRIYLRERMFKKSIKWDIQSTPGWTDHKLVKVSYSHRAKVDRGRGQWRLNTTFLSLPELQGRVTETLARLVPKICKHWERVPGEAPHYRYICTKDRALKRSLKAYDSMMEEVKATAEYFQIHKAKEGNKLFRQAEQRVLSLEAKPRTAKNKRRLEAAKLKLEAFWLLKQRKAQHNARAKVIGHGEGNTGAFWKWATARTADRAVYGLRDPNSAHPDKVQHKAKRITGIARDYYAGLYSKEPTDLGCQEKILDLFKQADFSSPKLKLSVTTEEVTEVISAWANCKTPGSCGIPYEFFKTFLNMPLNGTELKLIDALCIVMTIMLLHQRDEILQPKDWSDGYITPVYKKGDPNSMVNYRPLAMMNALYKLFTTVLTHRIIGAVAMIIGPHQNGFLPARSIFDSIKEAQTLVDRAEQLQSPVYLLLLDQEKAYDRVDHAYLWRALERIGMPETYIRAIKSCYRSATTRVMVNGHMSEPFDCNRGVRQGDPLSCILYDIAIEPLAQLLLNESRLPGYEESEVNHKVLMYADDTLVVLRDLNQWKWVKKCFRVYAKATNARLNENKCEVVAAGCGNSIPKTLPNGIKITYGEPVKYLGVPIGVNLSYKATWIKQIENLRARIKRWAKRWLSYRGRIRVITTMLQSTLWYLLRCIPIHHEQMEVIQSIIHKYAYEREESQKLMGPIPAAQASRPVTQGGLGLINTQVAREALSLYWIHKLAAHTEMRDLNLDKVNPIEGLDEEPPFIFGEAHTLDVLSSSPKWIPLMIDIMRHNLPVKLVKEQCQYPWIQAWETKNRVMPPSVQHFWSRWSTNAIIRCSRRNLKQPVTAEEVDKVRFWYHPVLTGNQRPLWGFPVWQKLSDGFYGETPEVLRDLRYMRTQTAEEMGVDRHQRANLLRAFERLIKHLPVEWKAVWPGTLQAPSTIFTGEVFNQLYVYRPMAVVKHVPLTGNTHDRYLALLEGTIPYKDLFKTAREIALRDNIDLTDITEARVWESFAPKPLVFYPKVTDLLWRIALGRCRVGENWMPKTHCHLCRVRHTVDHLFVHCRLAQAVWVKVEQYWVDITGHTVTIPATLGDVLFGTIRPFNDPTTRRRWLTLYSEALWILWTTYLKWSFSEIEDKDYNVTAVGNSFRRGVLRRFFVDRQIALGHGYAVMTPETFELLWSQPANSGAYPPFLGRGS